MEKGRVDKNMVDWKKGWLLSFVASLVGFLFFTTVYAVVTVDCAAVLAELRVFFASVASLATFAWVFGIVFGISGLAVWWRYMDEKMNYEHFCIHYIGRKENGLCPVVPGGGYNFCYEKCSSKPKRPKFWRFR